MLHIRQMNFDTVGLEIKQDEPARRFWAGSGPILVEQSIITPTDYAYDLRAPDKFRQVMLDKAKDMGSALLQCAFLDIQGLDAVRLLNKFWSSPATDDLGKDYNGALVFPLAEGCFFIRVAAREQGMTGVREAMVAAILHKQGKLELPKSVPPADASIGLGASIRKHALVPAPSDDEQYDADFPEHPLTRVRRMFKHIENTLTIAPELKTAKPYRV